MYADSARHRVSEKSSRVSAETTLATHFTPSRRQRCNPYYALRIRPSRIVSILKVALPIAIIAIIGALFVWEPHIELAFYSRAWIQKEIIPVAPLAGCFDPGRVSEKYNVSEAVYGRKRTEVQAGMSLKMGLDCYDFAGTVQPEPQLTELASHGERVNFHTYWREDLATFLERQEWMLKSFFATQDLKRTKLIMWSNGDLRGNKVLLKWIRRFPDAFELRVADIPQLSRGTELEGSELLKINDEKAWVDGDLIRLLVLWAFGGVWVDMDSLLTRDLSPLFEHEFVTQWDCYGACIVISTRFTLTSVFRKTIPTAERGADAFPSAFALFVRSLSRHADLDASQDRIYRLGVDTIPESLEAACSCSHPTIQSATILLL